MLQHKNVIDVFRYLLSEIKPSRIIEIGTEFGGLTLLLQDLVIELGLNTKIRTYDIKIPKFLVEHPDLTDLIEIRTKDIFTYNPFRLSDEGVTEVKDYMVNDGVNLILCDGGNKSKEFNSFSDIINVGDVIMLHDYIINEDEFESNFKNKIWNWHESKLSDIEESIVNNKLEPYLDDEFSKVVWGCFIKK
jgi:cephalosporin hydroxylase